MTVWHRSGVTLRRRWCARRSRSGSLLERSLRDSTCIVAMTVDALDTVTGELWLGQLESAPAAVEQWVAAVRGPGRACRGRGMHRLAVRLPGTARSASTSVSACEWSNASTADRQLADAAGDWGPNPG
jgi:hypothetical protein